jgi:ABC-2 type transport system permease protein
VTLDVRARKVVVDESGVETEAPMSDSVEIGIVDEKGLSEPIYLHQHHISAGRQTITVTASRKPARAGIDPRYLLTDWETDDNVKAVRVQN